MTTENTIDPNGVDQITTALAKAQGEMENPKLDCVNPHFKSKYSSLAAIRNAVTPALAKHGIALTHVPAMREGQWLMLSRLIHGPSGQVIEAVYPLDGHAKPQQRGSDLTYAKRQMTCALTGVVGEEDDDGNGANEAAKNGKPVTAPAPQPHPEAQKASGPALISTGQLNELTNLADEVGADVPAFLHWLEVPSMDFIPAYDFLRAKKGLEGKRAKVEK